LRGMDLISGNGKGDVMEIILLILFSPVLAIFALIGAFIVLCAIMVWIIFPLCLGGGLAQILIEQFQNKACF